MKIQMFETSETPITISEFVKEHRGDLSTFEMQMLRIIEQPDSIPPYLQKALSRAKHLANGDSVLMNRAGERSAYGVRKGIKFKGCNPKLQREDFPTELTFFGKEDVVVETIPFGVMTESQVLREILGYTFFKEHGLNTNIAPVCVFPQDYGFCLVESSKTDKRLESFLDFTGLSIADLIADEQARSKTGLDYRLGTEVSLKGINIQKYSYEKAKQLVEMNFNGGFRGLLNSNIGNDVIIEDTLYLCDFDTFALVDIPKNPTEEFLKRFYLQSFVEIVKGSLPIIEIANDVDEAVQKYKSICTLYRAYRREFFQRAEEMRWEITPEIEQWAESTPIFKRTICEIVPTYEKLKKLPDRKPIYRPH